MIVSFCRMHDVAFNEALQALGVIKPEQYVELWKSDEIIGTRKYQRWWCCYGHCQFDSIGRIVSSDVDFLPLMLRAIHLDTRPNTIVFNKTLEYILGEYYNKESFDNASSVVGLINYMRDLIEHANHTLFSSDPFNTMHRTTANKIIASLPANIAVFEWIAKFDITTMGHNAVDNLMQTLDRCDMDDINFRSQEVVKTIQHHIGYRSDEELWKYCYTIGMPICAPDDGLSLAYITSKTGVLSTKTINAHTSPQGIVVHNHEPFELPKENTDWVPFIPRCMQKTIGNVIVPEIITSIIVTIIESVMNVADGHWNLTIHKSGNSIVKIPGDAGRLISMIHSWADTTLVPSMVALFNQLELHTDKYGSVDTVDFEFANTGICLVRFLDTNNDSVFRMAVTHPLVIINRVVEYC